MLGSWDGVLGDEWEIRVKRCKRWDGKLLVKERMGVSDDETYRVWGIVDPWYGMTKSVYCQWAVPLTVGWFMTPGSCVSDIERESLREPSCG